MAELIPAILVQSKEEFVERVALVTPYVELVQVDVMDGKFVPNTTWADPGEIARMRLDVPFEVHLMVQNPEEAVGEWITAGAKRIFVHQESSGNVGLAILRIKESGREAGIAINPPTSIEAIADLMPMISAVLVMGVTPGASGQQFQEIALEKVKEIRRRWPKMRIEVDGGVKLENARALIEAGADGVVAASVIYAAPDPIQAINDLKTDISPI